MLQRTLCKQAEVDAGGTKCRGNRSWLFTISCSRLSLLSRPHAVDAPVPCCRGPVLCRRRPRVILSKALCCPASNIQWHSSAGSSFTLVWAHQSRYSASASWDLLHCAQISNHRHHPPWPCHSHLPSTLLTPRVSKARHCFDLTCTAFLTSLRFSHCLITAPLVSTSELASSAALPSGSMRM